MDIILNNANFRKLWFSSTFAGAASNIIQYALSLYVLDKTGSATAFASILSIIIFPRILFSPIAGVWGDRVDRQKGLVYTTLMTVITLLIFGVGTYVASNLSLVAIYFLVIILELVEVFQSGPMMSVLPAIVDENQLATFPEKFIKSLPLICCLHSIPMKKSGCYHLLLFSQFYTIFIVISVTTKKTCWFYQQVTKLFKLV